QYSTLVTQLAAKGKGVVRDLDPEDDLTFLRIRSKKHEIMVAESNQIVLANMHPEPARAVVPASGARAVSSDHLESTALLKRALLPRKNTSAPNETPRSYAYVLITQRSPLMKRSPSPRVPSALSDASDSEFEMVDVKRDDNDSDPSSSFEQKHFDFTFVDKSIEWARKTDVEALSLQVPGSTDSDAESVETAELVAVTQSVAQQLLQNTVHAQNPPRRIDRDTEPSQILTTTHETTHTDIVVTQKTHPTVAPNNSQQQDDFKTLWQNHQRRFLLASTTVLFGLVLAGIAAFFVFPRQNSAKAPPAADPIVVPIPTTTSTTQSNSIDQVPKTDAIYQNKFSLDLEGLRETSTVHSLATPASTKKE
ncbi:hypothetical protein HDU81_000818, partial [Chytriomyces hyalinus]